MTPQLSVIIPVRNGADFIERAIASATSIPAAPIEIVVIDDGLTDGTASLLQRLGAQDERLVVLRRNDDHGAAAARNAGIRSARGKLVCFLDADDILHSAAIARRLAWHEAHPETVLSFANYETLLPDGTVEPRFAAYWPRFEKFLAKREGMIDLGPDAFDLLFGENPVCTTGVIARRAALLAVHGFVRDLRQAEDWDLWIRLARCGGVAYSTSTEALHTARAGSLSTDIDERTQYIVKVVSRHIKFAFRHHPSSALAALCAVKIARAEQARFADNNIAALVNYIFGFIINPSTPLARHVIRSVAVLLGFRSAGPATFEQRARLVSTRASFANAIICEPSQTSCRKGVSG